MTRLTTQRDPLALCGRVGLVLQFLVECKVAAAAAVDRMHKHAKRRRKMVRRESAESLDHFPVHTVVSKIDKTPPPTLLLLLGLYVIQSMAD